MWKPATTKKKKTAYPERLLEGSNLLSHKTRYKI